MEIAMLRGGTGGRATGVMKSGSDDSFFFTRANDLIHGLGPRGETRAVLQLQDSLDDARG